MAGSKRLTDGERQLQFVIFNDYNRTHDKEELLINTGLALGL
jgi:hypothetical protein